MLFFEKDFCQKGGRGAGKRLTPQRSGGGGWGGGENTWHRQAFGGEKVGRKCEKGMSRERKKIRKNAHLLNKNKQKLKHGYNLTLLHGVTEYAQFF
jgi:hypothetical protein